MSRRAAAALVLAAVAVPVLAHDSWLTPGASASALTLSTGNRYPVREFNPGAASIVRAGCSDGMATVALAALRDRPRWLDLQAKARAPLLGCFVEMKAYELEMAPDRVPVYLDEIRASQALREAWRGLQARGVPWRERYRKFVRIELAGAAKATPARRAQARKPLGLPLEAVVVGDAPVLAGKASSFQVLRDGEPLAGLPVQFLSERSPLGIWRETDAEGKVSLQLPFGGRWLLRGVELKPSPEQPDQWSSRFLTLGFEAP